MILSAVALRKKLGSLQASSIVFSRFENGHLTSPRPKQDACLVESLTRKSGLAPSQGKVDNETTRSAHID